MPLRTGRLRAWLIRLGSFALAGALLYLALRGANLAAMRDAFTSARYRWLFPLVGVVLLSHLLRAWRWTVLLDALPARNPAPPSRASLGTAFASLMIGYMVNYATPRLGELVRTGNQALRERRSFGAVLGTVIAERVLDVLVLALAVGSTLLLLASRSTELGRLFFTPIRERLAGLPLDSLLVTGGLAIAAALLLGVLAWRSDALCDAWSQHAYPALATFRDGLVTVLRSGRPAALILSTFGIWCCYTLMAYLPLRMLSLAQPYGLGLLEAWELMALGSLGMLVPSPGGLGSYHYVTVQSLAYLFGVPETGAAAYAVLTHGAQLLLYLAMGSLCLVLQGDSLRALLADTRDTSRSDANDSSRPHDDLDR